jgi:hypothetical protein
VPPHARDVRDCRGHRFAAYPPCSAHPGGREGVTEAITVESVLLTGRKGPAVELPFNPERQWNVRMVRLFPGRRGYPVTAVLNRLRFTSAILRRRGCFFVLLDEATARKAGVSPGDFVRIQVSPLEPSPTRGSASPRRMNRRGRHVAQATPSSSAEARRPSPTAEVPRGRRTSGCS